MTYYILQSNKNMYDLLDDFKKIGIKSFFDEPNYKTDDAVSAMSAEPLGLTKGLDSYTGEELMIALFDKGLNYYEIKELANKVADE